LDNVQEGFKVKSKISDTEKSSRRKQKNEREPSQLLELNRRKLALQIEILQLEKKLAKENLESINRENKHDKLIAKRENYNQFEV
jgi:hypothetical protein